MSKYVVELEENSRRQKILGVENISFCKNKITLFLCNAVTSLSLYVTWEIICLC